MAYECLDAEPKNQTGDSLLTAAENGDGEKLHVVAYDFGIKENILRMLTRENCRVTVVPATARAAAIADLRFLAVAIRRAVLPSGEISDDASPELKRIRGNIGRTRDSIRKTLERMLRTRGGDTGEDYVTLRNDRFVIPVRASDQRQVQGVVHAASATGQTVFVEPFETIELNNMTAETALMTSLSEVCQLRTLTRIARRPLHVVPMKKTSPSLRID